MTLGKKELVYALQKISSPFFSFLPYFCPPTLNLSIQGRSFFQIPVFHRISDVEVFLFFSPSPYVLHRYTFFGHRSFGILKIYPNYFKPRISILSTTISIAFIRFLTCSLVSSSFVHWVSITLTRNTVQTPTVFDLFSFCFYWICFGPTRGNSNTQIFFAP